jgi:xeroderma pigmentosum group C-complementing protein
VIYPRTPVLGYAKGEPIYPRSHVHTCLTVDQWLREEGRTVVRGPDGDLPLPALWAVPRKQRGRKGDASGAAVTGSDAATSPAPPPAAAAAAAPSPAAPAATLPLYGPWQTEPFVPPPHTPGSALPCNQHGNIELWGGRPCFLPAGLAYIPLPQAKAAAKSLGVDYVEAMVRGRSCDCEGFVL